MAVLHAAAAAAGVPLYAYLLGDRPAIMPIPEVQIFGGGAHAGRRVDIQDFMVVAPKARSFAEALEWTAEIYRAAGAMMSETGRLQGVADEGGFWPAFDSNEAALDALVGAIERAGFTPGDEVSISLDIASSEFYRDGAYRLALGGLVLDSDAMSAMLIDWLDRYPIVSIEDPLAEHDATGFTRFTKAVGHRVQIVGDDFLDDRFRETDHGTDHLLVDSSFVVDRTRSGIMAGWRQAVELAMTGKEIETLTALSRSRTEPASRVSRAAMLLGYREKPSFFAVGRRLGVHHQTVQRCVERAVANGALAALDDRPRPGKEPTITPEAKAWLVSLACDKAKEHGYPHELWTTRLLARHAREHGPAAGHDCLAHLVQGTVCKILGQEEIKPHKVRYYLERRDAEFEHKMAEVLCVYREVQVLKKAAAKAEKSKKSEKPVAIVSFDEKPGIQAIATTAPDLPPVPGVHPTFARDHEYKRHGTLSLLAGIDLLSGKVHALVRDRHRSREFIEFLKLLDAAYPASTAIKLILDNHSAHISRETRAWLDTRPAGRFDFTFTPKHGSWLNLIEGFFSKFARSVLRHIRVTSKHELKQRIMAGIDDVNRHPVLHTWSYKLAEAA
jgi:transposase